MPVIVSDERVEPEFRPRPEGASPLVVSGDVMDEMVAHAAAGLTEDREIMGLMTGRVFRDDIGMYAVVTGTATSDLVADRVSVRFDSMSMDALIDAVDAMEEGQSLVGWYHSHPGYGCFMSETDVRTQDGLFGGDCGFAVVIDPVRGEIKAFDSTPGNPAEIRITIGDRIRPRWRGWSACRSRSR